MMQNISKKAGLLCSYTCHSVRASTITVLYRAGVDSQSIISITKDKKPTSLSHYIENISNDQKKECNDILSNALGSTALSTVTAGPSDEVNFRLDVDLDLEDNTEQVCYLHIHLKT